MYLSRVEIDVNNRKKLKDLTHIGAFHNWVERSFPEEFQEKIRTRKLWRIDSLNGREYLLIVSEKKPDLKILETYGVEGSAETKAYDNFLKSILGGKKYKFRVTLNPVVSEACGVNSKRGRVRPVPNDKQLEFLWDRSEKNGFLLERENFYIVKREHIVLKKQNEKDVNLSKAVYEGVLTVIDKSKFVDTLTLGFGKKKAYGFGMMTIIPWE